MARLPAIDRVVFERAEHGNDHAVRGSELAKAFMLPQELIEAVALHHDPVMPDAPLAKVAWVAERVAAIWEGGDVPAAQAEAARALVAIGVGDRDIAEMLEKLPGLVTDGGAAFERDVGPQKGVDQLLLDVSRSLLEMNQSYEAMVRRLEKLLAEKEELVHQARSGKPGADAPGQHRRAHGAAEQALARAGHHARPGPRRSRTKPGFHLVVVDVDHFKKFNDSYGHATGDIVLQAVGKALSRHLRAGDLAGSLRRRGIFARAAGQQHDRRAHRRRTHSQSAGSYGRRHRARPAQGHG